MQKNKLITICTAAYNRGDLLPVLFASLKQQTVSNFEWIIIDDGSTDNTRELVEQFKVEVSFPIIYDKQKNQGKHTAINRGVVLANGSLFFIVDSDDRLPEDALDIITSKFDIIKENDEIAGVVGLKHFFDKKVVGSSHLEQDVICDIFEYRYVHKVAGDRAEVFKTSVLRDFPFPRYGNEKFLPESIVWNRIGQAYKMLFFNKNVYECEYLEDGLSAQSVTLRRRYPQGILNLYSELGKIKKIGIRNRMKAFINFWRFYFCDTQNKSKNLSLLRAEFIAFLCFPIGVLFYLKDTLKHRNRS